MAQSGSKRSTMVEDLLARTPRHEPEVEEAMEAFREARARSRGTAMLDFRFLNGTVESFSYSYLTRVRFEPGDLITLRFGRDEIHVTGKNLARLCETITEQRTSFIQEGTEDEELLKPDGAPHIDQISITELEDV